MPAEGRRADWAKLTAFLSARSEDQATLSWDELIRIVGAIPASATRHHPQWWHGDRSHIRAWRAAGYTLAEVEPGRSVTFRRSDPSLTTPGPPPRPNTTTASPGSGIRVLQETEPRGALLVIPCSKRKRGGGDARIERAAPWPPALLAARERTREAAHVDEHHTLAAWRRYTGEFYVAAQDALANAVSEDAPLVILSGGYGLLRANEPIGNYDKIMHLADWPHGLLEDLLIAEARRVGVPAVVAFAAASTDYARLLRRVRWRRAGLAALLVTVSGVAGGGAMRETPRRLGSAFACFWMRRPIESYPVGVTVEHLT
ncbi:hypothetical protein N5079_30430 [Planotetraspora sp. A-T 1434]|uniref:DUF7662 domain-containing protein n=1 Tax=Planotetraspora sp. A-T 1434 TaxID=2979219 RepID=UPI0021C1164C|nr:hypothetical protein [Planotetraspora sp. A-T 1434]MCT9934531.1 hypothetical protein [Planotetraspora sp. A-T 1434]